VQVNQIFLDQKLDRLCNGQYDKKERVLGEVGGSGVFYQGVMMQGGVGTFVSARMTFSRDYTIVHRTLKPEKSQIFSELLERLTEQATKLTGRGKMMKKRVRLRGDRGLKETRTECHCSGETGLLPPD